MGERAVRSLRKLGHNVTHARINTEKGVAVDTIYLRDPAGHKINDAAALQALAVAVASAIQGEVATAIRS